MGTGSFVQAARPPDPRLHGAPSAILRFLRSVFGDTAILQPPSFQKCDSVCDPICDPDPAIHGLRFACDPGSSKLRILDAPAAWTLSQHLNGKTLGSRAVHEYVHELLKMEPLILLLDWHFKMCKLQISSILAVIMSLLMVLL